jgi:preprotein translocase subunit SecG
MTFAVINWLNISINLLLVIFVIICVLMTLIILMQRPKQEGLGAAFGGGVTDQVFGARTTNVLQRGTVYLGSLFFIFALLLAVLIGQKNKTFSTVTKADIVAKSEAAKIAEKPAVPPSLTEQLPATAPVVPVTPAPVAAPSEITPATPADPTPTVIPAVPATGTPEDKPKEP